MYFQAKIGPHETAVITKMNTKLLKLRLDRWMTFLRKNRQMA